ncbi:MAG: hypothetical protein LBK99_23555, partial [Opitutaceae bacterium]|nr:hypothetical protein [Opitutaceae bacterium]
QLMLIDTTWGEGIRVVIGACIGVLMIGVAVEGFLFMKANGFVRVVAMISALCLIDSGLLTDLVGLAGLAVVVGTQYFLHKKEQQALT